MSRESVPGHDISYHLVCFDETGNERGHDSADVIRDARAGVTDVFFFVHGWNGDVPAARHHYGQWVATMAACRAEREAAHRLPGGFKSLLVGLHWPSKAWGDEDVRSEEFVRASAARLGGGAARTAAVRTIVEAALRHPCRMSPAVKEAYVYLEGSIPDLPGEDGTPFDPQQLYRACLEDPALGGILSPLRILTFWKMKRRARVFGESGAARIAREVAQAAPNARVHLMGHSFGCITATAMASVVPPATLTLVQGAMSLWSFAERLPGEPGAGYFRGVLGRVPGPIIVTTSTHDHAIGRFYPLAARSGRQLDLDEYPKYGGIGAHGVQGTYAHGHRVGAVGELTRGQVHNVDCSSVIRRVDGIAGAHNDICHPELARVLWRAVLSR
ncbi:hypothetical protein BBK82_28515 [Lentzea guizhouensis]|uniref:Serine-threonine protein kinase n=1 Tax=Lentzea guizhouensis TaxID=1586287 RepID=A0A1B2HNW1_9PSEU|nr:hypothetical protein [Lentzea guizhouensis]ANZ39404.1 hypothetical protein BBK82_28515 [Lentzea guizhouensis]